VDPDNYGVTEGTPVEGNWIPTTSTQACFLLAADGTQNVSFGNVCLGAGNGLTLGFWNNKDGQSDDGNNNKNFVQSSANHCPFSFNTSDSCPFTNP